MEVTHVILSPGTLEPLAGALAGTACDLACTEVSLSLFFEGLETLLKSNISSLRETGVGTSGWAEILD